MKTRLLRLAAGLLAALFVAPAVAQNAAQPIPLKPGWNSVWLTVDPSNPDPAAVFNVAGITQVWAWFPTERPVQFVENPAAMRFNAPGWRFWMPTGQPQAFLSNLGAVQARRAYLVKYGGTTPTTFTVSGTASNFRPLKWRADSFNLFGFDVDPQIGGGPAGLFFSTSDAHAGQPAYRLDPNGTWVALTASSPVEYGKAYWVFSKGPSSFNGPVAITLVSGDLDFGEVAEEKTIILANPSPFDNTVTFANPDNFPLVAAGTDGLTAKTTWADASGLSVTVPAGAERKVRFGVRRAGVTGELVRVVNVNAPGLSLPIRARVVVPAIVSTAPSAGLWAGTVTLSKVNDVNAANPTQPLDTPAALDLRLLVHVDAAGQARLLKQVTLLRQNRPTGLTSNFVLVTDDRRITDFKGATLKDGKSFGYRLSSVGYDFAGSELPLLGVFGSALTGQIVVGRALPTNPMKHKYHPDHDDLDARFNPLPDPAPSNSTRDQDEVWNITRDLSLTFDPPPADDLAPAAGYSRYTGTYRETLGGLHRQPLYLQGTFTLKRVNPIATLNPAP